MMQSILATELPAVLASWTCPACAARKRSAELLCLACWLRLPPRRRWLLQLNASPSPAIVADTLRMLGTPAAHLPVVTNRAAD